MFSAREGGEPTIDCRGLSGREKEEADTKRNRGGWGERES